MIKTKEILRDLQRELSHPPLPSKSASIFAQKKQISFQRNTGRKFTEKQIAALKATNRIRFLQQAEIIYKQTAEKFTVHFDPQEKVQFWDSFKSKLHFFLNQALTSLPENANLPQSLNNELLAALQSELADIHFDMIETIFKMIYMDRYCKEFNCVFLRATHQRSHPYYYLHGHQCIGVVFDWAQKLWTNPPTTFARPTAKIKRTYQFMSSLEQEKFPSELLLLDTYLGERILNNNTKLFQKYRSELIDLSGKSPFFSENMEGDSLVLATLKLFSQHKTRLNNQISFIVATLFGDTNVHMVGFAEIRCHPTTYYRFIDADIGEFEASCPEKFAHWMKSYCELHRYRDHFSKFNLRIIDPAVSRLASIMSKPTEKIQHFDKHAIKPEKYAPHDGCKPRLHPTSSPRLTFRHPHNDTVNQRNRFDLKQKQSQHRSQKTPHKKPRH